VSQNIHDFGGPDVKPPPTPTILFVLVGIFVLLEGVTYFGPVKYGLAIQFFGGFFPFRLAAAIDTGSGWPLALFNLVSYSFLHSGWMHLIFNSLLLLALGRGAAYIIGAARFLLFYIACALGGAIAQYYLVGGLGGMVGASGVVFGMAAAHGWLTAESMGGDPAARRNFLIRYSAGWMLANALIYVAFDLLEGQLDSGKGGIAWAAHLGGYVVGLALFPLFIKARFTRQR
jgi:membrane associated rhomboid family serine protease